MDYNTNAATLPLYMLHKSDYWFHHINKVTLFSTNHLQGYPRDMCSVMSFPQLPVIFLNCMRFLTWVHIHFILIICSDPLAGLSLWKSRTTEALLRFPITESTRQIGPMAKIILTTTRSTTSLASPSLAAGVSRPPTVRATFCLGFCA